MKTSFILATLATVAAMASASLSVDDQFRALKHDPHGYMELLDDGRVVSYDQDHKIIDFKVAEPKAIEEYKKLSQRDPDSKPVTSTARPDEEELFNIAKRDVCNSHACDDDLDCQAVGCYGGCRVVPLTGRKRCYP